MVADSGFAAWEATDKGGRAADDRLFVEAVLYLARTGSSWRDLPKNVSDRAIARSRGGLTTKVQACVDTLGNPVRLILTAGQLAYATQGPALVEAIPAGAEVIVPPLSNRNTQSKVDRHRYKARNYVERFFNRRKQFRRIATRYDKLANRFNAFLHLACAYIWSLRTRLGVSGKFSG